jgi:hypothetical protein
MAIGIDCMLISVALAQLSAAGRQAGHRHSRSLHGGRHPGHERGPQCLGVHWRRLRRRSLGAGCLRLFRAGGNQWGHVYPRPPYTALILTFRDATGRRGLRSITFKRATTSLSNPDAADSLPAGLNLACCHCKSGADEAH